MGKKGPREEGGAARRMPRERGGVGGAMHQGPAIKKKEKREEKKNKERGGSVPLGLAKPEMDEKECKNEWCHMT
jgi:hypothetical protein